MFLSPFKGSAEVNYSNPIIIRNSSSDGGSMNFIFMNDLPGNLTSAPVTMTAGDYYYFELIYAVTNYGSFMKSSIEVPNTDTSFFKNTKPEIQNISLRAPSDPEILKFTQIGATNGTFNISAETIFPWSNEIYRFATASFNWNASAEEFSQTFRVFDKAGRTQPVVDRQVFD